MLKIGLLTIEPPLNLVYLDDFQFLTILKISLPIYENAQLPLFHCIIQWEKLTLVTGCYMNPQSNFRIDLAP